MGFDAQGFTAAVLAARTITVPVPELRHWFGDSAAVWTVRALSGEEIARANDAQERSATVLAVAEALMSAQAGDKAEAFKTLLGVSDAVPEDLVKRIDHLVMGSVDPVIHRDTAVRLFEYFPVVAFGLTKKILELTGLGAQWGKPDGSGDSPTSEPR